MVKYYTEWLESAQLHDYLSDLKDDYKILYIFQETHPDYTYGDQVTYRYVYIVVYTDKDGDD
jgi:hypothetical protein